MHKSLKVKKVDLEKAEDSWDYLYVLLDKYYELQNAEPNNIIDNFTNYQHTLMAYTILDAQVCNGGFIQLIENGYGKYIFESPFIETLKTLGAIKTVELLEKVYPLYKEMKIDGEEHTLDEFSKLYTDYPQFEEYDDAYYGTYSGNVRIEGVNVEVDLIKEYVESHLSDFIIIE